MKKVQKNHGFALVETLIVSAFVVSIFMLLYTNLVPMIGEYEKRENYDTVDNTYKSYFIKRLIENDSTFKCNETPTKIYDKATGCSGSFTRSDDYCNSLLSILNVDKIYITTYKGFNKTVNDDSTVNEYLNSMSGYTKSNNNTTNCRIIVKYEVKVDKEEESADARKAKDKYQFSTIGVNK